MARTSKTVIGGGSQDQSRTMMQASQSGTAAKQRATESLSQEKARGTQQKLQGASQIASGLQQSRAQDFHEQSTNRAQDLQEAQAGFTRAPELDQRSQQLQAEMGKGTASGMSPEQQQNLQEQGDKPLEIGGQGATQPGELRQTEYGKRKEAMEQARVETARMNAETAYRKAQTAATKAQFAGDTEAVNIIAREQDARLEQRQELLTRMVKDEPRPNDFDVLRRQADEMGGLAGMPDGGKIEEILKSGKVPANPEDKKRLTGFIQAMNDRQAMRYVTMLGEVPGKHVDFSGPVMKQFQAAAEEFRGLMQMQGPAFQQFMGITSQADKLKAINKFAASRVLQGKAPPPQQPMGQPETGGAASEMAPPPQAAASGMAGQKWNKAVGSPTVQDEEWEQQNMEGYRNKTPNEGDIL